MYNIRILDLLQNLFLVPNMFRLFQLDYHSLLQHLHGIWSLMPLQFSQTDATEGAGP